ncbi:hypothetical protein P171DRAFT_189183 [Karstenula rhodostoma CBS 690.94]|uniref:Uncharacterized protein n=1 Tax=Karstenula rhodostoma CBS 690.94 TaxID=1392251 RepID=A0A9P4UGK5_9PLEO|nr:hypothetical protein P171DRAFT_189183 [Karstenula rhodostoma CBS 690.94]
MHSTMLPLRPQSSRRPEATNEQRQALVLGQTQDLGDQSASGCAEQQQNRPRPVPHGIAVRPANRSTGAPLATIVEQGSGSTLHSHSSLYEIGRFPSIRTVENASHRHPRTLDAALNRIQEEGQDELTFCCDTDLNIQSKERRGAKSKSYDVRATAAGSVSLDNRESPISRLAELNLDMEPKSLKALVRGVLTKVRNNTRSPSRPSWSIHVPMPEQWSDVSSSAQTDRKAAINFDSQAPISSTSASTTLLRPSPSSPHHVREPQATNGPSPKVKTQPWADGYASQSHVSPSTLEPESAPLVLQLSPTPNMLRFPLGKEVLPSACFIPLQPRDAALDHVRHAAATVLGRSRDELATRYTPDGAFPQRNDGGSLDDFARNASQNASFCSTMSTSYSGTALGIDLDIQHEFPGATRRSVTPVWFSPKEPERPHEPPKYTLQLEETKPLRPRSITSSALTSLLPIAAAEGIVQQNLTMPQLTFYSPSGNLIQAQSASFTPTPVSSSRSRSDSYFSGTPTTTTSYYNGATLSSAQSALSAAVTIPPARPALAPLTTPPQSTAPLPENLRHHHNYHRVDKSRIESTCDSEIMLPSQVVMTSDSQVFGCGGVVRSPSLDPHSGVPKSPPKHSRIGQSISCLRMREANRSAINASSLLAPNASCKRRGLTPAQNFRKKGKKLQKRRVPHMGTVLEQDVIGPAAGHALRVCFCQPYDGVGRQTSEAGCGSAVATQLGERRDESRASPTGLRESTPNARIVAGDNGKGKGRARRDSAVSVEVVGR